MAVDNRNGGILGLINPSYGARDPGMNVPLTSNPGLSQLSPYLNFDPNYLQTTQPEYFTLEGASQKRGRFELAFSQIGGCCLIGSGLGGAHGFYRGLQETSAAGLVGSIRRTQLLNYTMKRGSAAANTLGVMAVMYSGIGCLIYYARDKEEDHLNTLSAGTLTGLLYKSTAGIKKCAVGGLVGLAISAAFVAFSSRDKLAEQYKYH